MASSSPMQKYWFGKHAPEHADAWYDFYKTVSGKGVLDKKTKELVAVAVGSVARCKHCVEAHVAGAKRAGASKEEIAEALMVASWIVSGAELFWSSDELDDLLSED